MSYSNIKSSIATAATVIGKTWPLYSFVTSNPLSGYEQLPFKKAVATANGILNSKMFPEASVYRQALTNGEIHSDELASLLKEHGYNGSPEMYLKVMEASKQEALDNPSHQLDKIMAKWLAAFMDEGLAEWEMPRKEEGFFTAWRELAAFDNELNIAHIREIPKTTEETLTTLLASYTQEECTAICSHHLAALPGWTGYINYRTASGSSWQEEYPIQLEDYLAVRLFIASKLDIALTPATPSVTDSEAGDLAHLWLQAWERSWQKALQNTLDTQAIALQEGQKNEEALDAQLVFCIDTRSELIRRHVESKGRYETFGYAGFFGIAMDYVHLDDGITRKACPPIVGSAYTVREKADQGNAQKLQEHQAKKKQSQFLQYFLKRMKNMLPSAFGYVEGSGVFYGIASLIKTLFPGTAYRFNQKQEAPYEHICQPDIQLAGNQEESVAGIPLDQQVGIVKSAFDLTGWTAFAPLVVFAGHGSHSANNPFGSSLDCGACAASPGKHNARMLAQLANLPEVREQLASVHGVHIPEDTLFIGAQHNTTTDEIELFEYNIPSTHLTRIKELKADLRKAQKTATAERLGAASSIAHAQKKANNWGETRPEWGLAKNAGFIIAPRALTKDVNLDSRCFLHSYDWETDTTGKALEGIMQGPMVVTQWINNHYYFATVDNNTFGGGSKVTHNITGKFGVVQGNGGDLKMGLPLQSVSRSDDEVYHRALRLSVVIKAPLQRVTEILLNNPHLKTLLDNEWIYLMVIDPLQKEETFTYNGNMKWTTTASKTAATHILEEATLEPTI